MSITQRWHDPEAAVTVGGEYDKGGRRGFVLLAVSPSPCLLTKRAAKDVARALVRFAEIVRPSSVKRRPPPNYRGKALQPRKV